MKIAILGTRGIPNEYGGFEQFAESLSTELVKKGHNVTVYNPHFHKYNDIEFKGVKIKNIYSPEKKVGAIANFVYDYLCLKDAAKEGYDIYYELGYSSASPSYLLIKPKNGILLTNMDGLEWKRAKWNRIVKWATKFFEYLAVHKSDYLIADNEGIQEYYKTKYNADSVYLAYPASVANTLDQSLLSQYNVKANTYFLVIARLEPENNIEMIINGYLNSGSSYPLLIIGNTNTKYGKYLLQKYAQKVSFLGGIYNKKDLDSLRKFCLLYFHGHSVGGTNPSLLEAMASETKIAAHKNKFNSSVLTAHHPLFCTQNDVVRIINTKNEFPWKSLIKNNLTKIEKEYSTEIIISQHEELFKKLLEKRNQ